MYILPSLFTTANVAFGYYAIIEVLHATAIEYNHLDNAARAIGFAVLFDGLDGRIARMTGTSSDFGRELDSLADVITFGVAPAMLAWAWGFHLMPPVVLTPWEWHIKLAQLGAIASFLFLIAGASRLARFNITSNPTFEPDGRQEVPRGDAIPAGVESSLRLCILNWRTGRRPILRWYGSPW
jgi:CDP-diacylglycerol--serine O-phosphatidyltransferase